MTTRMIKNKRIWKTADLALAAALFLSRPLMDVERQPDSRRAFFVFEQNKQLDKLMADYWQGRLKVEPRAYFEAMRAIKSRLYGEE